MARVYFPDGIMAHRAIRAFLAFILCILASLASTSLVVPAEASDGLGISGSFASQDFDIPQGSSVSGPSIDIIIYNNSAEAFNIRMTTVATNSDNITVPGITVSLTQHDFVVAAGSQQKVLVGVAVGSDVPPGQYRLAVTAEKYTTTSEGGIVIGSAVGENAWLTVSGYSASVSVQTVGTSGQPVAAIVRLWRLRDGEGRNEVAYSNTGSLQALVAPGRYVASAYSISTGDLLLEQESSVVAGDDKTITLTVETVFFEGFAINEYRNSQTGELGWAQVVYTVSNNYQLLDNARILLVVNRDGALLEESEIWGPLTLPTGRTGAPYNYIPSGGSWRGGTYGFALQLQVEDQIWAGTNELTLEVEGPSPSRSSLWILFLILGILGTAGLGFLIFFLLKKRKKSEKKPAKAEKKKRKKKEERPSPKVEEPVRKPEPVRREPPARKPEPTEEAAPLSSISSLKARMASLERDQAGGPDDDEEPDVDEKGVSSPPEEAEKDVSGKTEARIQKPPVVEKPAAAATPAAEEQHPLQPSPPVKASEQTATPDGEIKINWPQQPAVTEQAAEGQPPAPAKPDSDMQTNWKPKPASSFAEAARLRLEAQQKASEATEEGEDKAGSPETAEEPATTEDSADKPAKRSSFAEAARRRMQARQQDGEEKDSETKPEEPEP